MIIKLNDHFSFEKKIQNKDLISKFSLKMIVKHGSQTQ
jgi:hypothetical protein